MRIVTWNVNSVRARLDKVVEWVKRIDADAYCLQETKVVDEDFPREPFEELGYTCVVHGQKTYNGVAILCRGEAQDVRRGFDDGDEEDPMARILRATVSGVRLVNVYVPNGKAVGDEKYDYKLGWLARLDRMLRAQENTTDDLVMLGDFNIAPEDIDTWDPEYWAGRILCSDPERAALARLVDFGLTDCLRMHHQDAGIYSWWDYRQLGFQKRRGLRIDFLLATETLAARSQDCFVEKDARRGKGTSDHAPVVGDFD